MDLRQALRLTQKSRVALVGSGGKTTAMFQLARQLDPPVVVTTSTHLGEWQLEFADHQFTITRAEDIERYASQIKGVTIFCGPVGADRRAGGLVENALERVFELSSLLGFPVLVEADGSRQKPLKAPGPHEPVIPHWSNHVVVCAGLSGLGKPLAEENVHRAEVFSRLSGIEMGAPVILEGLFREVTHPEGGLKNIPQRAKRSLVLSQVPASQLGAEVLFNQLIRIANYPTNPFHSISTATLEEKKIWANIEPTAGILLAAGEARRFGAPKLLAEWKGKPLVRHAAEKAVAARLDWIGVVVGTAEEQIRAALAGLPVQVIQNPDWRQGQSASIRAGITALPEHTGSAIFLLGDQPQVPVDLIIALVDRHRRTQAKIIAPTVQGRRANPVLFDQATFTDLSHVEGDTGGRAIFGKYPMETIEWNDPAILLDIDTPGDLDALRDRE